MSAAKELQLKAWGRTLNIRVNASGSVCAHIGIVRSNQFRMLAWTGGIVLIAECRLQRDHVNGRTSLWIGNSSFDVSADEAKTIERELVPLGLQVQL